MVKTARNMHVRLALILTGVLMLTSCVGDWNPLGPGGGGPSFKTWVRLTGHITDAATGEPVIGARVRIETRDPGPFASDAY